MIDSTNCIWLFLILFSGVLGYAIGRVERDSAERFPEAASEHHGKAPL